MSDWPAFVIVGLMVWRLVYAVQHARRDRSATISRWTDPWGL